MTPSFILLDAGETRAVEKAAIAAGHSGAAMMEAAGRAAAALVAATVAPRPAVVLCGPGNNGGDGFVVARILAGEGWPVRLALLGDRAALKGDAAAMAARWEGPVEALAPAVIEGAGVIVDALFGTGLTRPIDGVAKVMIEAVNVSGLPVIAVDIPSGVDADTGAVLGTAIRATATLTFIARKPGHLLFPGRAHAGAVSVAAIGVDPAIVAKAASATFANEPLLFIDQWPQPDWDTHKYKRGHVAVLSGGRLKTGAARLAALSALRAGAGLVTVFTPADAAAENAAHLTAVMLREIDSCSDLKVALADPRLNVAVAGPGLGVGASTKERVLTILTSCASAILDADALTSFEASPETLFPLLRRGDILTPHGGEFARLFPDISKAQIGRLAEARSAASRAGAVVVLKGADTIIAAPDGRAAINATAPPYLATAGAGDALAGIIAGIRAAGTPAFEAACAGVFVHSAAAVEIGPGLIAEDIPVAARKAFGALFPTK